MYYVYRYTDLSDGIIKYVGIVYGQKREIKHRVIEHMIDEWCRCKKYRGYKIEYFSKGLNSRTDCETWESHLIAKYETYKWFNIKKAGWGLATHLIGLDDKINWKEFKFVEIPKPEHLVRLCNQSRLFNAIYTQLSFCIGSGYEYRGFYNNINMRLNKMNHETVTISQLPQNQIERLAFEIYFCVNEYLYSHLKISMRDIENIIPDIKERYYDLINDSNEIKERCETLISMLE